MGGLLSDTLPRRILGGVTAQGNRSCSENERAFVLLHYLCGTRGFLLGSECLCYCCWPLAKDDDSHYRVMRG